MNILSVQPTIRYSISRFSYTDTA